MQRVLGCPQVKRLHSPSTATATPVAYYTLRLDRTPPQHELFNLCLVSEDNTAFIKMFETYANEHRFLAPSYKNITSLLVAPTQYTWDIPYVDLEIQTRDENNIPTTVLKRFNLYHGAIDTECLFLPAPEPNPEARVEGLEAYSRQKRYTHGYTVGFLAGGATLFQVTSGPHSAAVFIFGCLVGMLYQVLLQYEVDRLGKNQMFINSATRLGMVVMVVAAMFKYNSQLLPTDLWIGTCGFLMQKVALLAAFV
jgi:hypothetical protein